MNRVNVKRDASRGTLEALTKLLGGFNGKAAPRRSPARPVPQHRPDPSDASRLKNFQNVLAMQRAPKRSGRPRRSLSQPRRSAPRPPY